MQTLLHVIHLLLIYEVLHYDLSDRNLTPAGMIISRWFMAMVAGILIAWLFDRLRKEGRAAFASTLRSVAYNATLEGKPVIILPTEPGSDAALKCHAVLRRNLDRTN